MVVNLKDMPRAIEQVTMARSNCLSAYAFISAAKMKHILSNFKMICPKKEQFTNPDLDGSR